VEPLKVETPIKSNQESRKLISFSFSGLSAFRVPQSEIRNFFGSGSRVGCEEIESGTQEARKLIRRDRPVSDFSFPI